MHRYHIQYKVLTPSRLFRSFRIREFTIQPFAENNHSVAAPNWIASGILRANAWQEAHNLFIRRLSPILDAMSLVSQSSCSSKWESFTIYRRHPLSCALVSPSRLGEITGLHIDREEWPDVLKLLRAPITPALHYLRLGINDAQAEPRMSLMLSAAEALAGSEEHAERCPHCSKETKRYRRTIRNKLKEVLGGKLYTTFYGRGSDSLRNKLVHGDLLAPEDIRCVEDLYERIRLFVVEKIGLKTSRKIVRGPRTHGTYQFGRIYVKCSAPLSLRQIETPVWNYLKTHTADGFETVVPQPSDY